MSAYEGSYLEQYWPPRPNNPDMWQDNLELLRAYADSAREILRSEGAKLRALDISTGPCLAPLLATMPCISDVLLSDYTESNRKDITESEIDYWSEYAREIVRMYPVEGLSIEAQLSELDGLRRRNPPLDVDLRRTPIFLPESAVQDPLRLLTMHFVVDSICSTADECFAMLDRVLEYLAPGGWLILSSLIDSSWWLLGEQREPSPRLSERQVQEFLESRGLAIRLKHRSTPKVRQIYEGGWTVFLAHRGSSR